MPIYEFSCNACGSPVSVFVRSMNSPVNGKCEKCGSTDLKRLISQVSIPRFSSGGGDGLDGLDMSDPEMAAMMQQMGGMGGMGGMGDMGGFGGMDDFGGGFDD